MEYHLLKENKKVRYNPYHMKKDEKIGEGNEGEVYLIKGKAVKFYKPYCNKKRLNKEQAIILSNINTKRILMPLDILENKKKKMMGYTTKYIKNLEINNLLEFDRENLKQELMLLKEDLITLSNNCVHIWDLVYSNICFNNGIYYIDPGSYLFYGFEEKEEKIVYLYNLNIEKLNNSLVFEVLKNAISKLKTQRECMKIIVNMLENIKKKKYPDIVEYLISDIKEDNLKEYILRK